MIRALVLSFMALGCSPSASEPRSVAPRASGSAENLTLTSAEVTPSAFVAREPTTLPSIDCNEWSKRAFFPYRLGRPSRGDLLSFLLEGNGQSFPPAAVDVDVLVLSGRAILERGGAKTLLESWHTSRVRGGSFSLVGDPRACVVIALSTNAPTLDAAFSDRPKAAWTSEGSPVPTVIDVARVPELVWADGKMSARLLFEEGHGALSILSMSPDQEVAEHSHDTSEEILFGISGAKWLYVAGEPGQNVDVLEMRNTLIEPRGTAIVKAGIRHLAQRFHGTHGDERFFAVQLYAPGGPEQRFKALGKPAVPK